MVCVRSGACWWFRLIQPPTGCISTRRTEDSRPPDALANHETAARGKRSLADASAGRGRGPTSPAAHFFKYCFLRANMALVWHLHPQQSLVYSRLAVMSQWPHMSDVIPQGTMGDFNCLPSVKSLSGRQRCHPTLDLQMLLCNNS